MSGNEVLAAAKEAVRIIDLMGINVATRVPAIRYIRKTTGCSLKMAMDALAQVEKGQ